MTAPELQALLARLEAQLQALLQEAAAKGITVSGISSSPSIPYAFTRDLMLGMRGKDVNALQGYLIQVNKGLAAQALAKHSTTDYFGPLTKAALIEFQKAVGIHPDSGYFGPITRRWIEGY
jgi:peptidoglycan hydrolase-like protein with peptidoglycan-binding domain